MQFEYDIIENNAIPKDQRRFFYSSKNDAIKNLPNQEISKVPLSLKSGLPETIFTISKVVAVPKSTIITSNFVNDDPAIAFTTLSAPTCEGSGRSIVIGSFSEEVQIEAKGIESELSRKSKQIDASLTTEAKIMCFILFGEIFKFPNLSRS